MDTTSVAHRRAIRVDEALLEEISQLTGIEYRILSSAFAGEPKDLALDVVKTAVAEHLGGSPESWGEEISRLAKPGGLGEHRPGYWDGYELSWEYNEFLRSIGRLA